MNAPAVSVIVPTRNRASALRRSLDALRAQTYPPERTEVVVVADGCTDETPEMVRRYPAPFSLRCITQPHGGAGAARNRGASAAGGTLLVFLDDDVEAAPGLVAAHVAAQQRRPGGVVIGRLPPLLGAQRGFFRIALRRWWEAKFDALAMPGHRFHAFDLLSGNLSLGADLFARTGGFDPSLRCHEDYELGVRLMKLGVPFHYAPDALGFHHERTDLRRTLRRKFEEGQADVQIGRRHPDVRRALPMAWLRPYRSRRSRALFRLAFTRPAAGDAVAAAAARALDLLEQLRFRSRWRRLLDDLLSYWYWRGVAQELATAHTLARFLNADGSVPAPEIEVDLRAGIESAQRQVDEVRPAAVRLRFGPRPVARILPHPGAEPLRGKHLLPILGTHLARPLLRVMAQDGTITPPYNVYRLLKFCSVPPRYDLREHGIALD